MMTEYNNEPIVLDRGLSPGGREFEFRPCDQIEFRDALDKESAFLEVVDRLALYETHA